MCENPLERDRLGRKIDVRLWLDLADPRYYNRQGQEIDIHVWAELAALAEYRIVACHWIGPIQISTAWTGVDIGRTANYGPDPILFETVILHEAAQTGTHLVGYVRYATEDAARATHDHIVRIVEGHGPEIVPVLCAPEAGMAAEQAVRIIRETSSQNLSAEEIAPASSQCHDPDMRQLGDNLRLYPQNRRSERGQPEVVPATDETEKLNVR